MNNDYLLAITVLACLAIYVLIISSAITGAIYFVALYFFQFKIEALNVMFIIVMVLTGVITYWRISKC